MIPLASNNKDPVQVQQREALRQILGHRSSKDTSRLQQEELECGGPAVRPQNNKEPLHLQSRKGRLEKVRSAD